MLRASLALHFQTPLAITPPSISDAAHQQHGTVMALIPNLDLVYKNIGYIKMPSFALMSLSYLIIVNFAFSGLAL